MGVDMPAVVVLVFCKVAVVGPPDQNAQYTGHQSLAWDTEHSQMVCRRKEIQLYDPSVDQGAQPRPFNNSSCWRAGFTLGPHWDATHPRSRYRFWRTACPVPIVDTRTGEVIAWKIPECGGERGTVVCEGDITL
jgi:hypothetical protein